MLKAKQSTVKGVWMVSLNELSQIMVEGGYKLTPRTIKYYIELGLLPKPAKIGTYKKGVRLEFRNKDEVLSRLKRIFELKGRGFKLAEIKETIVEENTELALDNRKKFLQKFVESNGTYLRILDEEDFFKYFRNKYKLASDIEDFWRIARESSGVKFSSIEIIRQTNLFRPLYIYQEKIPFHLDENIYQIMDLERLHRQYHVDWDIIKALYKKQKENVDKYYYYPNLDGMKFSKEWLEHNKQWDLNWFATELIGQIGYVLPEKALIEGREHIPWDDEYNSCKELIDDFLNDRCAFLTAPNGDKFLKKLCL